VFVPEGSNNQNQNCPSARDIQQTTMTSANLHNALLRPAVLQILKATGFNYTRPAVLDTVTDLAARYLLLLASSTAQIAFNNHNSYVPTVQDVRMALLEAGALRPQLSVLEEEAKGLVEVNGEMVPFEDLRGINDFMSWAQSHANKEIRRVAGFGMDGEVGEMSAELDEQEDYLTGRI
jgi:transcription initiation factor TFIID subunit 3